MAILHKILPYQILLLTLLCIAPQNAEATIYKCVDSSGKVHFTDTLQSKYCRAVSLRRGNAGIERSHNRSSASLLRQRAARFDRHIRYYGVRYNIDPHLIRAVIRTESAFDPRAISRKGAKGLMQLMPGTARQLKVANPFDPEQNIAGGTRYLRSLLDTFRQDVRLALAAYNAGPTIVKKQQTVPQYPETLQYVKRVLTFYRQYKNGAA
jgi:soluble lytic murein transglycosylase-like protein